MPILVEDIKKDSSLTNLLEHSLFYLEVCLNIQNCLSSSSVYTNVTLAKVLLCMLRLIKLSSFDQETKNSSEIKETDQIL